MNRESLHHVSDIEQLEPSRTGTPEDRTNIHSVVVLLCVLLSARPCPFKELSELD